VRTDPTDNGGLFIGRRPGTAPVHYADAPVPSSPGRRRVDATLATALLVLQVLVSLLFWGPVPAGALWLAAQLQVSTGSVSLGIFAGFVALLVLLLGGLGVLRRLDDAWILVRRAAGHDQRQGVMTPIFGVCAVLGGGGFLIWLVFIGGIGSTVFSAQS
jgi:hypothetical protein